VKYYEKIGDAVFAKKLVAYFLTIVFNELLSRQGYKPSFSNLINVNVVMRRYLAASAGVLYLSACVPWLCRRPLIPSVCL